MTLVPPTSRGSSSTPGTQLAYAALPATVSVTATAEATPDDVVSAGALTFDGTTRVKIEFFAPIIDQAAGTEAAALNLWDGATDLGRIAYLSSGAANASDIPVHVAAFLTPSAGSHTFKIRGWRAAGAAFSVVSVSFFGATYLPAFIQVTQA